MPAILSRLRRWKKTVAVAASVVAATNELEDNAVMGEVVVDDQF